MNGLLTVTQRELRQWRPLLWIALALSGLAFTLPWLPGLTRNRPEDVRTVAVYAFAALLALGLSLFYGASLTGREVDENRTGFYLALPLTAGQIWFGKLLAGILLLTGSTLLIVLPSVLAGSRLGLLGQGLQQTFVLTPVATILVLFLAHGFGTALRSRTPWIAYDVTGLVLTMFLVNLSLREFARYYSTGRLQGCLVWILVVISGWLLGGYLQHSRGRADIQRGHRWLTLVAWSVTILASLGLLGRAYWTHGGTFEQLERHSYFQVAPEGPWVLVSGTLGRRWGITTFLHNTESGESTLASRVRFDPQDSHAAITENAAYMIRSSNHNPAQLVAWRLGTTATPLEIPLVQYDEPPRLAANDEYLAVLSEDRVQLFSVDPWEPIGSAAIPKGARVSDFSILTDGSVRLFTHDGQFRSVKIFDLKGQQMVTKFAYQAEPGQIVWYKPRNNRLDPTVNLWVGSRNSDDRVESSAVFHVNPDSENVITATGPGRLLRPFQGKLLRVDEKDDRSVLLLIEEGTELQSTSVSVMGTPTSLHAMPDGKGLRLLSYTENTTRLFDIEIDEEGKLRATERLLTGGRLYSAGDLANTYFWRVQDDGAKLERELLKINLERDALNPVFETKSSEVQPSIG